MIGYILGKVTDVCDGIALFESNGIGYELAVSNTTLSQLSQKEGEQVKLFTYMSVRDDGLFLYGFYTKEEKNMFLKLISISGVGPKVALGILSGIELKNLVIAIISSDSKTLSKVKGIGKKTAERIILELRESLNTENIIMSENGLDISVPDMDKDMIDAVSALRSLGITQNEAVKAVREAKPTSTTIEELISSALRNLQ